MVRDLVSKTWKIVSNKTVIKIMMRKLMIEGVEYEVATTKHKLRKTIDYQERVVRDSKPGYKINIETSLCYTQQNVRKITLFNWKMYKQSYRIMDAHLHIRF